MSETDGQDAAAIGTDGIRTDTRNSRWARQNFSELLDVAADGGRVAIERLSCVAAGMVSPQALHFLDAVERADSVPALLEALARKEADGRGFVRRDLLAALLIAAHDRRDGWRGIMELKRAVATSRDGKVVLIECGDDPDIIDGALNLTTAGDGSVLLHGWFELGRPDAALTLELSNGQLIEPERFERAGNAVRLYRVPVADDLQLEFTKLRM